VFEEVEGGVDGSFGVVGALGEGGGLQGEAGQGGAARVGLSRSHSVDR